MTGKKFIPSEINGKRLTLILWAKDDKKDDVVAFAGEASFKDGVLTVDLKGNPNFEILPEWFPRIKKVTKDIKQIALGADYCLSLSVGRKPKDASDLDYKKTGLKWPD